MQMQMECTGIDECEYVEFRFKQVNFTEWDAITETKGVFAVDEQGKVDYKPDLVDLCEWQASLKDGNQYIYWVLVNIKKNLVPKDTRWLPDHFPDLKAFWDDVLKHRAEGTRPEPLPPKTLTINI
jgi:hypothetical protein